MIIYGILRVYTWKTYVESGKLNDIYEFDNGRVYLNGIVNDVYTIEGSNLIILAGGQNYTYRIGTDGSLTRISETGFIFDT